MIGLDNNVKNCDMPVPDSFGQQYGWICPVCGKGLAPWVRECSCVNNNNNTMNDISTRISYSEPMPEYKFNAISNFITSTSGRPHNEGESNERLIQ